MTQTFTLEYWVDDGWYVGRLKGVPGVFSQGKTLDELERNVRETYELMADDDEAPAAAEVRTKELQLEV